MNKQYNAKNTYKTHQQSLIRPIRTNLYVKSYYIFIKIALTDIVINSFAQYEQFDVSYQIS